MESRLIKRNAQRIRRSRKIKFQIQGTAEKPRLCVRRSNQHIAAQLIDDDAGRTLASVSTLTKEMKELKLDKKSKESARHLGKKLAELALGQNVKTVVFDRGFRKYHGVLAELASAAREAGLEF